MLERNTNFNKNGNNRAQLIATAQTYVAARERLELRTQLGGNVAFATECQRLTQQGLLEIDENAKSQRG